MDGIENGRLGSLGFNLRSSRQCDEWVSIVTSELVRFDLLRLGDRTS